MTSDISILESICFEMDEIEKRKSILASTGRQIAFRNKFYSVANYNDFDDYFDDSDIIAIFQTEKDANIYCRNLKNARDANVKDLEDKNKKLLEALGQHPLNFSTDKSLQLQSHDYIVNFMNVRSWYLIENMTRFYAKKKAPVILLGIKKFRNTILDSNGRDVIKMIAQIMKV